MTVKTLKELLVGVPDDMKVYVTTTTGLGAFVFMEACDDTSGRVTFGPDASEYVPGEPITQEDEGKEGFVLVPHGMTRFEDDEDDFEEPDYLN